MCRCPPSAAASGCPSPPSGSESAAGGRCRRHEDGDGDDVGDSDGASPWLPQSHSALTDDSYLQQTDVLLSYILSSLTWLTYCTSKHWKEN